MPGPYKWRHRFKDQVCRWTLPREVILELLSRTSKHLSAKDIYVSLRRSYPGLGLTTVYRTLDLLVRSDLVNKYAFGGGQSRYEFKPGEKKQHHHHLICTRCGKIIDYSDFVEEELRLVEKTERTLARKYKFVIQNHNVVFFGLCETCRQGT